ncbi:MAG TPA: hypothetical protein VL326_35795 [Kofleriaceae bacterium]|nr:hypothetical protein [Kofleriaceae bacterium]
MKTASVLFGLVVATGVAHANPAPAKHVTKPVAARTLPAQTRALLRQSPVPAIIKITPAVQRPRAEANGDMACGNVMTKGGDDKCTVARPLVDKDGDVAAGNVMKKTKK